MTIINGIDIDVSPYAPDEIRKAILNNSPIDNVLHVVAVISNPCLYARRYILAREFINRMEKEENVILYVVELTYGDQKYYVTDKNNKRHLQLNTATPLWHKENMINVGIKKLLPPSWKAVAWIDADIEFENPGWALDALKVLNGCRDVIQLFSHAVDMDKEENAMSVFPSFGFQYSKGRSTMGNGINMWHPGFAWACTRSAYNKMGQIYDVSILGAGDRNMALAFIGKGLMSMNGQTTDNYKQSILDFQKKVINLRLGYSPGVIRHFFHGSKKNRKYEERWKILVDNAFSPSKHITENADGLLVPTPQCPPKLLSDIMNYFLERNEDEGFVPVQLKTEAELAPQSAAPYPYF
jgi:hypothetical protein